VNPIRFRLWMWRLSLSQWWQRRRRARRPIALDIGHTCGVAYLGMSGRRTIVRWPPPFSLYVPKPIEPCCVLYSDDPPRFDPFDELVYEFQIVEVDYDCYVAMYDLRKPPQP
jgi:hypothetical protein